MSDRILELLLRIRTAIEGAESVDDLRQNLGDLTDEIAQAANPTDEFNQGLRETEDAGQRAGAGVKSASDKFGELTDVVKGFIGLALAKEVLDLNDRLTTLKRGFDVVTGGGEATDRALSFVRETADRLGVSALDLAGGFLKITAAAKGTQLEGAPTEKIFASIAGAMATVGGSGEDLERVMDAVGQMMGKGVVSAEELRGQLGDSLPGAVQQAAQALMVSNAELSKMLESGEIVASEFLPKFADQLEKSMGGGGQRVETFAASWNRLMNQLADLGTGPVGKAVTDVVVFITDKLGILVRGAGFAGDTIGALGRALGGIAAGDFSGAFNDLGQSVSDATLHMMGLQTESEAAAERQRQIAEELRNLTPEMDRFQDAVGRSELKELPESLQGAITELRKTGDVAAATEQAITNFISAPAKNLDLTGVLKLATSLQAVGKEAAGAGQEVSASLGEALSKLTNDQLKKLEEQARKAMAAAGNDQNARKVFADLGQVIEGVLLARLHRLGVDGPEALKGISLAAADAMDDFEALAKSGQLSGDALEKAFEGALAKLDSPEELEKFRKQILDLGKDGTLTGEQVERAFLLIRQRIQETANDAAFKALADQLAKIREETERDIDASDRSAKIKDVQIEAAIRLAKAKGDEAAAARLTAQATQEEVERARERTEQLGLQIAQIDAHIQKLYAQANADGQYTDAEREAIEALKEKSAELAVNRAQIEAHLPLMEREAQQAAIMAGPIGQLSRLYAEQTQEHQRAADASDRYYDTQLQQIDGAIKVAEAYGDEAEATKLKTEQQNLLIEQAQAVAQARAVEAADAAKAVDAKTLELLADGELSKADRQQIADLQEVAAEKANAAIQAQNHADAMEQEAKASEDVVKGIDLFTNATARNAQITRQQAEAQKEAVANAKMAGGIISKFYNNAIESLSSLSDNAVSAFKTMRGEIPPTTNSLDDMRKATEKIDAAIANVPGHAGAFVAFLTKITADANTVKKSWIDQADLAERLGENLQEAGQHGEVALAGMIRQAEGSLRSLNLLDQSRLDNLKQEIEDANERLREMQQETEDARQRLAQMNAELMETKGEDEKAKVLRQQIDYQETLADIEMQRQKAQLEGNRDLLAILDQQKSKLEEINTAKLAGIRAEAEEKKKAASTPPPSSNTGGSGSTSRSSGITQRYALDLSFGGKTLNATSEQDPADFLRALEHARLRT